MEKVTKWLQLAGAALFFARQVVEWVVLFVPGVGVLLLSYLQSSWPWFVTGVALLVIGAAIPFFVKLRLMTAARWMYEAFENSPFQRLLDRLDPDDPVYHWREELLRSAPIFARRPDSTKWHRLPPDFFKSLRSVPGEDDLVEISGGRIAYRHVRIRLWDYLRVRWSASRKGLREWLAK